MIVSWKLDAMESIVVKLDENKCNEYIEINSLEEAITTVKQYIMKNGKYDEKKFEKKIAKKQLSPEAIAQFQFHYHIRHLDYGVSIIKKLKRKESYEYKKLSDTTLLDMYRTCSKRQNPKTKYFLNAVALKTVYKKHNKHDINACYYVSTFLTSCCCISEITLFIVNILEAKYSTT